MKKIFSFAFIFLSLSLALYAEQFRTQIVGELDLRLRKSAELSLGFNDACTLRLPKDLRFIKAIEVELSLPSAYLRNKGSLALVYYRAPSLLPEKGTADVVADRLYIEVLPARLRNVYAIPLDKNHGINSGPYLNVPFIFSGNDDLLIRLMPIAKGFEDGIEDWRFTFKVRPIYKEEGALQVSFSYPEGLEDMPLSLSVDKESLSLEDGELILKSGEHQINIESPHFRSEHRQISLKPGQIQKLHIQLRDPAPLIFIQMPENAQVWLDGEEVFPHEAGLSCSVGEHELVFSIGDYTLTRTIRTRLGMSYEVNLLVDILIQEFD